MACIVAIRHAYVWSPGVECAAPCAGWLNSTRILDNVIHDWKLKARTLWAEGPPDPSLVWARHWALYGWRVNMKS